MFLSILLSFLLVEVPFSLRAGRANAGMIPTSEAVSGLTMAQNRENVNAFFNRQEVRKELVKFGVSANEASMRIASLSDSEIQRLAGEIDRAPAGGDAIVISLTTVLLVIIILILLGKI